VPPMAAQSRALFLRVEVLSLQGDDAQRRLDGGAATTAAVLSHSNKHALSTVTVFFRITYTQGDFRSSNFDQVANFLKNNLTASTQSGAFLTRFKSELTTRGASAQFTNAVNPMDSLFDSGYTILQTGLSPSCSPTASPTTREPVLFIYICLLFELVDQFCVSYIF
jgi:hypothetical protein